MAALILVLGAIAFAVFAARPAFARSGDGVPAALESPIGWMPRLVGWSLIVALASGLLWLALVAANMSGRPLEQALRGDVIGTVLTRTNFGTAWNIHLGLIALLAGYLFLFRNSKNGGWRRVHVGSVLLGACLVMSLAWAGHAAATAPPGRLLHLAADAFHLLAAGLWLGALVPLALVLGRVQRSLSAHGSAIAWEVARRFSVLGLASVGGLLATGLANAWFLVGSLHALFGTAYGRLLLVKVAIFGAMVAIAAVNRFLLTPRLLSTVGREGAQAAEYLRRNAIAELCLGAVIVAIVGILGTIPPAIHVHHH